MSGTIFDLEEYKPYQSAWIKRITELKSRKSYYDGSVYTNIKNVPMLGPRLYKNTKPLYLPLSRAVDIDVGIIPGGWTLAPEFIGTPIQEAKRALFSMSRWIIEGPLYVQFAAQYGTTGLKVADMQEARKVKLIPYDPMTFMLIWDGVYTDEPAAALIIEEREDADKFEYAEIITPEAIRTYKNGLPFGYDGREAEYRNNQGIVPIVEVPFLNTGEGLGEASFQKAIPMLNEVNQLASYLAQIIKDHSEAQWAIMGAEPGDLEKSGANVWFIPNAQGKVQAVVASIDITGVLEFIKTIAGEVKDSLPELGFDELRRKDQIATATMELQLMELVIKIMRVRPNLDYGLVWAMQAAGRAAADMGLAELAPLADEGLALDAEREILPLDPMTRVQLGLQELTLAREQAQARGLGIIDEDLDA